MAEMGNLEPVACFS